MADIVEGIQRLPPDLPAAPDGWSWRTLGELADPQRGICYGIVQPGEDDPTGVPMLRAENVQDGKVDLEGAVRVAPEIDRPYARSRLCGGEVLVTLVGAYFGKVAVAPHAAAGYNVARAVGVVPVAEDSRFTSFALRSPLVRRYMLTWATTTAQPTLNLRDLARLPIPWPPSDVRVQIERVLGALEDKISSNRRIIRTLEQIARAIFKSRFIDFDSGEVGVLQESALGAMPREWRVGSLGEVLVFRREGVRPEEVSPDTPYIGLEHMPRRSIALGTLGRAGAVSSGKLRFEQGDVLFGRLRPYFHKVGVAPVNGVCSTDILVAAPERPEYFGFVLGHLSSDALIRHADLASTGTKMPRASAEDLGRYVVAIPPPDVANAHSRAVRSVLDRIHASLAETRTLTAILDALLPRLLSGELRVGSAVREVEAVA